MARLMLGSAPRPPGLVQTAAPALSYGVTAATRARWRHRETFRANQRERNGLAGSFTPREYRERFKTTGSLSDRAMLTCS